MIDLKTKICSKCKKKLPATHGYFGVDNQKRNGLISQCKNCKKLLAKTYRINNHEKILQAQKNWYIKNKCKHQRNHKKWAKKNKLKLQQYRKEYYQLNKLKIQKTSLHPHRIYQHIVNKRKNKNKKICSEKSFIAWYESQNKQCYYCKIPEELLEKLSWGNQLHRKRLSIDRKNNDIGYIVKNIVLSCMICNTAKMNVLNEIEMLSIGLNVKKVWQQRCTGLGINI